MLGGTSIRAPKGARNIARACRLLSGFLLLFEGLDIRSFWTTVSSEHVQWLRESVAAHETMLDDSYCVAKWIVQRGASLRRLKGQTPQDYLDNQETAIKYRHAESATLKAQLPRLTPSAGHSVSGLNRESVKVSTLVDDKKNPF